MDIDPSKPEDLLVWIKKDVSNSQDLTKDQIDHICQIVGKCMLRFSDFENFSSGKQISEVFNMDVETAIQFWHFVEEQKKLAKGEFKEEEKTRNSDIATAKSNGAEISSIANPNKNSDHENLNEHKNQDNACDMNKEKFKTYIGGELGFKNLGNTCFLNSTLQCLLHTPGFVDELLNDITTMERNHNKKQQNSIDEYKRKYGNNMGMNDHGVHDSRDEHKGSGIGAAEVAGGAIGIVTGAAIGAVATGGTLVAPAGAAGAAVGAAAGALVGSRIKSAISRIEETVGSGKEEVPRSAKGAVDLESRLLLPRQSFKLKRDTMYDEWLLIVKLAHLSNKNTLQPSRLHTLIRSRIPELGDYQQHDSCEALVALLNEIEYDLPNKFKTGKTDKIYEFDDGKSIYDKKYDSSTEDKGIIDRIRETGALNLEANLISKYFDRIQVTQNICMNCGEHKRLFSIARILELPILHSYGKLTVFGFDETKEDYVPLRSECIVPSDCTAGLAKFYALRKNELSICDTIKNNYSLVLLSKEKDKCRALDDSVRLEKLSDSGNCGLVAVKNHSFMSKKANDGGDLSLFTKILCLHMLSDGLKKSLQLEVAPLLMDCLLIEKKRVASILKDLNQSKLGYFNECKINDTHCRLVLYVNGQYIYVSSMKEKVKLPLNTERSDNLIICLWEERSKMTRCDEFVRNIRVNNAMKSLFKQCSLNNSSSIEFVENKKLKTIGECMDLDQAEILRSCDDYYTECSNCGVAPILSVKTSVVKAPKILIVKFNRGTSTSYTKHSHVVKFNMELDFAGAKYDLFAINYHTGSLGFGHYTTHVKKLGTDTWLFCNDSSVSRVYGKSCHNAQFVIYHKRD